MRTATTSALALIVLLVFYKLTSITLPIIKQEPANINDVTGIISGWTSIIALLGAIIAYQTWLQNKIRDDAYEFIKKYFAYMSDLEYEVIDMCTRLNGLCPREGAIPLKADEALRTIMETEEKIDHLARAIKVFHTTKLELEHWDITLSTKGEELHHQTMIGAQKFGTIFFTSLNATGNYYANLEGIEKNKIKQKTAEMLFNNMIVEDRKLTEAALEMRETFNRRRTVKFKKLFNM